ncbi:K(+)-transporting ATPase subunit F [Pseudomonas entomophila]|nr:K(+)-transporting ATPase subunit F [Pseudomonas entomophila]MBA1189834.1 K(+)-transporting ATPase subunit F [Pseudomonas entomophila]
MGPVEILSLLAATALFIYLVIALLRADRT